MQVSKYYIEGQQAARNGAINASRYKDPEAVAEFSKGWESVSRDYGVLYRTHDHKFKEFAAFGTLRECEDLAVTLGARDRSHVYFVVDAKTGKEI